ncbi:uncharacterized protein LOC106174974 [Lingula anatina]|uniref:Uncharacterized protein LOC106174974 n=1 Tax=Lingula anatina TaxID=7574 RepID=A0A1S3JQ00_LINAN|nr:uncharacterized protein LOC106174974 [Lingula anatina]|eukprot:XP_013412221.1 uncharacterized protein LOC106174974 [Lingula anatina]
MASSTTAAFEKLSESLRKELSELNKSAEDAASILHRLANEIDEVCKKSNEGKIIGSAASLGGLPFLAAGFAIPVAAIGLLVVGGALCGGGGIKCGYHTLNEHRITRSKCSEAQSAVDAVRERAKAYKESIERFSELARSSGFSPVLKNEEPARSRLAVGVLVQSGVAALVTTLGRQILFTGFMGTLAMVPFDIYTISQCVIKQNSNNWSPQANKIRDLAREMHELAQEGKASLEQ